MKKEPIKGRGSLENIANRFERLRYDHEDGDYFDEEKPSPRTQVFKDTPRTIIATNDSPDIGFEASINPYRGCEHGCIYCYARPTHEYLGLSAGLDFETKIFVKEDAPKLLRDELNSPKWDPKVISMSGVTDCYQPLERRFQITRQCLQVLAEFRNPVGIVTKNQLVTRDIDILSEMAKWNGACVYITVTSLNPELTEILEPRTSRPQARLEAIKKLSASGIHVGVLVAPTIPALNDHEVPAILKAVSEAGAKTAGFVPLRLPLAVSPLFTQWLETHRPESKEKILERVRSLRGGKLNDSNFGSRMKGEGAFAEQISRVFKIYCKRYGLNQRRAELSTAHFRRRLPQLSLFDLQT